MSSGGPGKARHVCEFMTKPTFDQDYWEQLWAKTRRERADILASRPPNAQLVAEVADLSPGKALDAGCGHGADTLWLASREWQVEAVDFSRSALAHGRSMAEAAGAEIRNRIDWVEADLSTWAPEAGGYDLITCLYVHCAHSAEEMVSRMASGVAPGGTLFMVGHRPIDPNTGAVTAAANQVQVSVQAARTTLDPEAWDLIVAEERPRTMAGTGVDAVIRARRRV